jgi:hypothetical protein
LTLSPSHKFSYEVFSNQVAECSTSDFDNFQHTQVFGLRQGFTPRVRSKEKQKIVLNKMSNNNSSYVSKPPKFEGIGGTAYVIWSIKFSSWAGVKGVRATLNPSFDSKLPATEEAVLDNTDPIQKAQGKAILQNAIVMDAMVQCMSKTDNFHCVLQSMQEDVNWPTGKAWKTWLSIQNHYQPMDSTTSRELTMALQKIKLKKDVNPVKIMSKISAVEVRFKQSLSKEKKLEVVQGCVGDDYAQVIVVKDGLS